MKKRRGQSFMSSISKGAKMNLVPVTKASTENVETVKFDNPDDLREKPSLDNISKNPSRGDTKEDLDMKRTRFEIMKFGMSKLKSDKLEDAEEALAISLGAVPPKKTNINYKLLQVEKKKEKLIKEELEKQYLKPKLAKPKKNKKGKGKQPKKGQQRRKSK